MSLVPLLVGLSRGLDTDNHHVLGDDWDNFLDDDFGFGINPVDVFRTPMNFNTGHKLLPRRSSLYAPYLMNRRARQRSESSNNTVLPTVGKDGFQVSMDVSQFKPNELNVKIKDNTVIVEGKHEEREDDHGLIQRHFIRKYTLPKDYDPKDVVSTMSSDGLLTVKAPPPCRSESSNERVIQIQQTGPAHLNVKQLNKDEDIKQQQDHTNGTAGEKAND